MKEASVKQFQKQEFLSKPDEVPNEVFFINKGIILVIITDHLGKEHTIHFALENQFICDYSNFILSQPGFYTLHPTGKRLVSS